MSFSAGTRIGRYEILAPLGAGGRSVCGPREQASLRAAQRERLGALSRREARTRAAARAGGGAPARVREVGPQAHQEKQTLSPCR
jgi:hypothetical protein